MAVGRTRTTRARPGQRYLWLLAAAALASSCVVVRFNELEQHQTRTMSGPPHPLGAELRGHVLSPREAAVGGFSTVGAGGCGCH